MNDTTRWIMIALLLLLIGAAVFMLLRSPGKDRSDEVGSGDTDRDGVADADESRTVGTRREQDVYDQTADDLGPGAQTGSTVARAGDSEPAATPFAPGRSDLDETSQSAVGDGVDDTHRPEPGPAPGPVAGAVAGAAAGSGGATAYRPRTPSHDEEDVHTDHPDADVRRLDDDRVSAGGDAEPLTADEVVAASGERSGSTVDEHPVDRTADRDPDDAAAGPDSPMFVESIYGPGSAEPLEDGSGPAGWDVKGNIGSMLFHTADSPSYDAVRAEVWFESEEAARNAGFAHWDRRRR